MPRTDAGERWDPLGQGIDLPHSTTLFPLGFPLLVSSNDPRAIELASRAFPDEPRPAAPSLRNTLRIVVSDGPPCSTRPHYRAAGKLLSLAADSHHALVANMDAGEAALWTTRATLDDAARFVRWWIAGSVLQILAHRAVTPVHAACVARDGRGLLLCGPSGAGKSVMAWAAARAGFRFVSDDVSYLARREPPRVLGRPHLLRLELSAAALIPGLERFEPVPDDAPGERLYELSPGADLGLETAAECRPVAAVMLERRSQGDAEASPGAPILELLDATLPAAPPAVMEAHVVDLQRLAELPSYTLHYADPAQGATVLTKLL